MNDDTIKLIFVVVGFVCGSLWIMCLVKWTLEFHEWDKKQNGPNNHTKNNNP